MTENNKPEVEIEILLERIDALARQNFQSNETSQYQEILRPKLVRTLNNDPKQRAALASASDEKIIAMLRKHLPNNDPLPGDSVNLPPNETHNLSTAEPECDLDDVGDSSDSSVDVLGESNSPGLLGGLKDRAKKTAALVQKRLNLRSKESSLRVVYARIGTECVKSGIAKSQFPDDYSNLESIASRIRAKETAAKTDSNDSVSGQAKGMLNSGKAKIEIESLKSKRKGLLAEIGRKSVQGNHLDSQMCIDERKSAEMLEKEMEELKEAIAALEKSSGSLKTLGIRFAMVAVVVVVLYGGIKFAGSYFREEARLQREARKASLVAGKMISGVSSEIAQIELDIKRSEMQRENDAAKMQAEHQLALKQKELEEQQRKAELEQRAEKERMEREQREVNARLESATQRVEEQANRKAYIESRMRNIPVQPQFLLSRSLKGSGATVELRGKDWAVLSDMHGRQDWVGLINAIKGTSYTELPDRSTIDHAISEFYNMQMYLLIKTSFTPSRGREMCLLTLPYPGDNYYPTVVNVQSNGWEKHPDGIGYTHSWSPSSGGCVVMYGDSNKFEQTVRGYNEQFRSTMSGLKKKVELGEIDETAYWTRVKDSMDQIHKSAATWALSQ